MTFPTLLFTPLTGFQPASELASLSPEPGPFPECLPRNEDSQTLEGPTPQQRLGRITGSVGSPSTGSAAGPLWKDRAFALRMVRVNPSAITRLAPALQTDPEIAGAAILQEFDVIEKLPPESRDAVWTAALDQLESEGADFPRERIATYEAFQTFLEDSGLGFEDRFRSVRTVLEVAANRENLASLGSERPIALVIATTSDYNHAFEYFPLVDNLVGSGRFDVVYREASTEREAGEILEETYRTAGRPIHTLVLAGHGMQDSLDLGGPPPPASFFPPWSDQARVEISDFEQGEFAGLGDFVETSGQVLLWSCSNGAGGADAENLANAFSDALPGRSVISVGVPSNIVALDVGPDAALDVTWASDDREYIAGNTNNEKETP